MIGPDIALPDLIDLYMGTSSGGIVSLTLAMLDISISECKSLFRMLARNVFSTNHRKRFLPSWVTDGRYNSEALEEILKAHFGETRRLLDEPISRVSSKKVAVTVSSVNRGEPSIFTNYNGGVPAGKSEHSCRADMKLMANPF
jgi:patatin-like phospholipase/acyl hydrolase